MPVYEFQCQDCGKKFEIVATLAEKEVGLDPACPKCGRKRARQVFSRFTLLTTWARVAVLPGFRMTWARTTLMTWGQANPATSMTSTRAEFRLRR